MRPEAGLPWVLLLSVFSSMDRVGLPRATMRQPCEQKYSPQPVLWDGGGSLLSYWACCAVGKQHSLVKIAGVLNVVSDSENSLGLRELQPEQTSHQLSFKTLGRGLQGELGKEQRPKRASCAVSMAQPRRTCPFLYEPRLQSSQLPYIEFWPR